MSLHSVREENEGIRASTASEMAATRSIQMEAAGLTANGNFWKAAGAAGSASIAGSRETACRWASSSQARYSW